MNDLVVSIVSYNAADALERCLRHVEASDFPGSIEVVVVDNGSTDGAPDVAKGFAGVRVLEPGSNLFYSGGNNLAWEATESRYFLILNSDCYVDPDALATAVAYLDEHPAVGAVTLRMAFESGEEQAICARFQDRWYSLLWYTALGGALPGLRARAKGRVFYEGWDRTSTRPVEVAPDSFLMVRRSALSAWLLPTGVLTTWPAPGSSTRSGPRPTGSRPNASGPSSSRTCRRTTRSSNPPGMPASWSGSSACPSRSAVCGTAVEHRDAHALLLAARRR